MSWEPSALGSTLVFAASPTDTTATPDDGTGHAQFFSHLYDTSKRLVQVTSGNRPSINRRCWAVRLGKTLSV